MIIDHILIYKVNGNTFFFFFLLLLSPYWLYLELQTRVILGKSHLDGSCLSSDFSNGFTSYYKVKSQIHSPYNSLQWLPTYLSSWLCLSNLISFSLSHSVYSRHSGLYCPINTLSLTQPLNFPLVVSSTRILPADTWAFTPLSLQVILQIFITEAFNTLSITHSLSFSLLYFYLYHFIPSQGNFITCFPSLECKPLDPKVFILVIYCYITINYRNSWYFSLHITNTGWINKDRMNLEI